MALAPYNVLAGGKIRTDAEEERRRQTGEGGRQIISSEWERTPLERKASQALEKVAQEIGAKHITSGMKSIHRCSDITLTRALASSVAIAYLMQKAPYVFPVIGGRKVEQFHANLEALELCLTPEQIAFLDDTIPFNKTFPYNIFVSHCRFLDLMEILIVN